jgi:hypothetical protein
MSVRYREDFESWKVSGAPPRYWVGKPVHGHTLDGKSGRIRIFRTFSGAQRACDIANADRHKRLTTKVSP